MVVRRRWPRLSCQLGSRLHSHLSAARMRTRTPTMTVTATTTTQHTGHTIEGEHKQRPAGRLSADAGHVNLIRNGIQCTPVLHSPNCRRGSASGAGVQLCWRIMMMTTWMRLTRAALDLRPNFSAQLGTGRPLMLRPTRPMCGRSA